MKPALFIDRDGTINVNCPYCRNASEIVIYNDVYGPISALCKDFYIIIVTNQSGIARGYFTVDDLKNIHAKIKKPIKVHGGRVDAIYYCPDMPDSGSPCRKPNTGTMDSAMRDFEIDKERSFVIGDDEKDIEMARRTGIKSILLDGEGKNGAKGINAEYTAKDFNDVLEIIKMIDGCLIGL